MDMELISVENAKKDLLQNTILKNISGFALKRYFFHCSKKINIETTWLSGLKVEKL